MIIYKKTQRCAITVLLCLAGVFSIAQKADTITSDGLFQSARRAAFDSSDYPRAKGYLFKALKITPNYNDVRIFLGRIYTWTKNYDSARLAFQQVLSNNPDYEDAVMAFTDLEYYSANYNHALELARTGLRNNPASAPLMLREVKILNAMTRYDEADKALQRLLLLNPDDKEARDLSMRYKANRREREKLPLPMGPQPTPVLQANRGKDTLSADGLLAAARTAAFDNKNFPQAKQYLLRALSISPDYADLRIFLGRIYTWTKNYDSARLAFRRVLDKAPNYEDAQLAYADLEFYSADYNRALELARGGLNSHPGSESLMLREVKILRAMNRFDEAEKALQHLLLLNPGNTEAKDLSASMNNARAGREKPPVIITPAPPVVTQVASENRDGKDTSSSDGLLVAARKAAFDNRNYAQAKAYLYHALRISPGYYDVKVFLGRIQTWEKNYDSARFYFTEVLKNDPGYEDAAVALADMEFWNNNSEKALSIVDGALLIHPASQELLIRKAKILNDLRRYPEAEVAIHQALAINKNNADARSLANKIKELATKNKIGITYDYVYFDKQFGDPWHLLSFDYTRRTHIGSITGRVNYANRFKTNGVQYELEAYPHISKTFYSYISAGYSENVGVFPQWRGGFSLYVNLPKSYEAELGFRYLKFSGDPTWIYTGYIGKYYKSWLFGARTYLTPGTFTNTLSTSYNASARYYYGSADDLFGVNVGYGISPDDRFNSIQIDSKARLVSYKAGFLFKKKVSRLSVISIDGTWFNQEYLPQTKGNQYQFSLGWLHRF